MTSAEHVSRWIIRQIRGFPTHTIYNASTVVCVLLFRVIRSNTLIIIRSKRGLCETSFKEPQCNKNEF